MRAYQRQLTLDTGGGAYRVQSYEAGKIIVNGETITHSLIVAAEKLLPWQPQTLSELNATHLQPIFALTPELVLVGTGVAQHFLEMDLLAEFHSKHIGIEIMNTGAACRTYNVLAAEGRKVVAALLLS